MSNIEQWRFRKTVTAPFSGQCFTIRRIRFVDYLVEIGFSVSTLDELQKATEELKARSSDAALEEKTTKFYLSRGVVQPRIWFGDEAECPEDQISYADISADVGSIVTEIAAYSTSVAVPPQDADTSGAGIETEAAELN